MDSLQALIDIYLYIVVIDFFRYFIPASFAFVLFWVLLKEKLKPRLIQKSRPHPKKLWGEFLYSMSTVLIFALVGLGIVIAKRNGFTRIYHEIADFGWWYLIVSFVIMILFHDMYFYWTHRWMHHPKVYRHVHRVHHLSTNPSPWAAYSFHPLEAIIQALVFPILLFLLPIHSSVAFIFLAYMIVRNVLGHLGYELFPRCFMGIKWLNFHTTTTHHNLHHEKFHTNYGLYFTWWDRWCNTEDKRYKQKFYTVTRRRPSQASRRLNVTMLLLALSPVGYGQSPAGKWITYDESTGHPLSIIEIYQNTSTHEWEGQVDSIILRPNQGSRPICLDCPDPFYNEPVIGLQFLWGFRPSGDEWTGGKMIDPASGQIYNGKLWLTKKDEMEVRAYGGPLGFLYSTQIWKRQAGIGVEGVWQVIDDTYQKPKSLVRIEMKNNQLTGTIQELYLMPHEGHDPICVACKNELQNKPIVGMKIMKGFSRSEKGWNKGTILDPGNGTNYSSRFELLDRETLKVWGYWGPLYRTQQWKRFDE